ncbi:heterokaryon incompatibility protein 6, OR allele [Echria macrotheca]|uniref:Heterokaryon incompatibility protein 6, OR allele n=1 Tax=Echria macrotheca TaxID=438768 RepID=A0AAJ0B1T7_9PEZI|nr:heterokaryon incompatibility protein 6, OR allele [Echria macrotheca]
MAPLRLLAHKDGQFYVFDPRTLSEPVQYDIVSYTWGPQAERYDTKIEGVTWYVQVNETKLNEIKQFMVHAQVRYLWVDCVCINQDDDVEKTGELEHMYDYYTGAERCHMLLDMDEVWNPHEIVEDLRFLGHLLSHMRGTAVADKAKLSDDMIGRIATWAGDGKPWKFAMSKREVQSAAVEPGVLNCFASSVARIRSLFHHLYFSRVWTFQEMLLGKNMTMWTMSPDKVARIGEFDTWMDLATDANDKAIKLYRWIDESRELKSAGVNAILGLVAEDLLTLATLQTQVRGIHAARTDIISGGPGWWRDNRGGVANVFSAISFMERSCRYQQDIFRGLLGIFNGLLTPDEMRTHLSSGDDVSAMSFVFFQKLSLKTERAWTRLVISSADRGTWDWLPIVANHTRPLTTDCFSGVVDLGRLKPDGLAAVQARTGIVGSPKRIMTLRLHAAADDDKKGFRFRFRGCNCGKKVKSGLFRKEPIPTNTERVRVVKDETGRTLVQCATLLGSLIDPGGSVVEYRRRLLKKLGPWWRVSDRNAKPNNWVDRCVSGTAWADPAPGMLRAHNESANFDMEDIIRCESRLHNETTARIECELRVGCGCVITGPFSFIMEALTSVEGGVLGGDSVTFDDDGRIILKDGLGLAQVGDVDKSFQLVAFQGDPDSYKLHAKRCRKTKLDNPVREKKVAEGVEFWPRARALVRNDFKHEFSDMARDYGFVETGAGNLLICRNHPMDRYRVVGVCLDGPEKTRHKKETHTVTLR